MEHEGVELELELRRILRWSSAPAACASRISCSTCSVQCSCTELIRSLTAPGCVSNSAVTDAKKQPRGRGAARLHESNVGLGTVCVYQALSPEKIRERAYRVSMPATAINVVADSVVVRADPQAVMA